MPMMGAVVAALVATAPAPAIPPAANAPAVTLDRSQADAALAIIDTVNSRQEPSEAQLRGLYASRPYIRLRERENSMKRPFTDAEFLAHLRTAGVRASAPGLRAALSNWSPPMIDAAAARASAYLPAGAGLKVTIFPMIKIKPNTFVFDLKQDPSIFYALDPKEPRAKFANTLAHEMHHIGVGQNCPDEELPGSAGVKILRTWVGAFNEGLAMVAAAGGPTIHPHADSSPAERAVWDSETPKFDQYLKQQDGFFQSLLAGTAGDEDAVSKAMFGYFGEQGPWYSVGWRMAVTIEQELGRPAVIVAFCRPNHLLSTYNRAASAHNRRGGEILPLWDAKLAAALSGSEPSR